MASTDTTKPEGLRPARRTIVKGAAWAVPAIAVAAPAHAAAASQCFEFTFGPGSSRCTAGAPGADYRLRFCVESLCDIGLTEDVCIDLDAGLYNESGCRITLTNPTTGQVCIELGPGGDGCAEVLIEGNTRQPNQCSAANRIYFTYRVGNGDWVEGSAPAPISCLDPAAATTSATEDQAAEPAAKTTAEEPAVEETTADEAPVEETTDVATTEETTDVATTEDEDSTATTDTAEVTATPENNN